VKASWMEAPFGCCLHASLAGLSGVSSGSLPSMMMSQRSGQSDQIRIRWGRRRPFHLVVSQTRCMAYVQ
jgi:hypothetical protein